VQHERQIAELHSEIGRLAMQVAWMKKKAGIRDE